MIDNKEYVRISELAELEKVKRANQAAVADEATNVDRDQLSKLGRSGISIDSKVIIEAELDKQRKRINRSITTEIATYEDLKQALSLFTLPDIAEALFRQHGAMGTLSAIITGANKIADGYLIETHVNTDVELLHRLLEKANRYRTLALGLEVVLDNYRIAKGKQFISEIDNAATNGSQAQTAQG